MTYFYRLKFELYPTATPHISTKPNPSPTNWVAKKGSSFVPPSQQQQQCEIYLPTNGADIFDSTVFPGHAHPWDSEPNSGLVASAKTRPTSSDNWEGVGTEGNTLDSVLRTCRHTVIDCGPERAQGSLAKSRIAREGASGSAAVGSSQQTPLRRAQLAVEDWRFGRVRIESIDIDMASESDGGSASAGRGRSINSGPRSHGTKARFEALPTGVKNTEIGWGVVHLYRDGEEIVTGLGVPAAAVGTTVARTISTTRGSGGNKGSEEVGGEGVSEGREEGTTILCIPAVPSYMTPSDFLGWVGEKTREEVSHFRMVMTGRMNRYLVLLKFRDVEAARRWREEWDGKVFGGLEVCFICLRYHVGRLVANILLLQPENCHVMFIKSITFETPSEQASESFPCMSLDPFTPGLGAAEATGGSGLALKPFPPPTPSLVELPTCPVCLERMDDTTGLLTILCQHVFHCACLSKWRGSGCPVCRHTQPQPSLSQPFGTTASELCHVCDCSYDLWICLICGHVGCGRYKGGHAKEHWKETAHNFALEIETQHVWDYAGDLWVHRLIQTKGDGKLVDLPSHSKLAANSSRAEMNEDIEMVPRAKLENIGIEYTHLLTSQLESQRMYFEDIVKKAADKASSASKAAEAASAKAKESMVAFRDLELEHAKLRNEVIPSLEKDRDRLKNKSEKSSELARTMTGKWQEEKRVAEGLMQRVKHLNEGIAGLSNELEGLRAANEDLKEQNRDLGFFISGKEKLTALTGEGQLASEEVLEGTVSLPPAKEKEGKGKGKGKGRGRGAGK